MEHDSLPPIKCAYCDIMLEGRDQFMGHMIHSHELGYEQLKRLWSLVMENLAISEYPESDKLFLVNNKVQG